MVKPALALYEVSGKLVRPSGIVCGNGGVRSCLCAAMARKGTCPAPNSRGW